MHQHALAAPYANRLAGAKHVLIDGCVFVTDIRAWRERRVRRGFTHSLDHGDKRWLPVMDGEEDFLIVVSGILPAFDHEEAKLTRVRADREVRSSGSVGVVPARSSGPA
jgi:hypothetical protein